MQMVAPQAHPRGIRHSTDFSWGYLAKVEKRPRQVLMSGLGATARESQATADVVELFEKLRCTTAIGSRIWQLLG